MSSMVENFIGVDYRRLIPSRGNEDETFGIYEDEESRAQRRLQEDGDAEWNCPDWLWCDYLPTLSLKERLLGCITCMICGYLLSFGSFMRLKDLATGNPVPLVVNVTVGNIIALCGTCFLTGPQSQSRRMFHKSRRLATGLYLGSMGVILLLLFSPSFRGKGFALFLLLLAQYGAMTWYCLSYIPYAREFVKRCCVNLVNRAGADDDA